MTDNEIRIAIAEACGWHAEHSGNKHSDLIFNPSGNSCKRWELLSFGEGPTADHKWFDRWADCSQIPDYPNDLNAMHEAEQCGIKSKYQADSYIRWLHILVGSKLPYESMELFAQRSVIRATARQRAEAFLRTIGKWKEEN